MYRREIRKGIEILASVHWNRRLFDSLIPLPDGTSYNAYLIRGSEKTALVDTTDPEFLEPFLDGLKDIERIDYIVSQHSEQDHSGCIPAVLSKHPEAMVLCSPKAVDFLGTHLHVPKDTMHAVQDGERISLGDKSLQFVHVPWVHWPETMATWVPEDRCLFSCDFLGSHLATTDLFVMDKAQVYEAAKRYFAEIMMPFRSVIKKNLDKISALDFDMVAPGHGPVYDDPQFIIDAYRDWVSPRMRSEVVIPYISMHGSTARMVQYLTDALVARGLTVKPFDLAVTDIGKLAIALVDAGTLVVGTPTVHVGPHPAVYYAAHLANMLHPKLKYAAIIGSYGWSSKAVEQIAALIPNLKVDVLGTVMQQGVPTEATIRELDALAEAIAIAHRNDPDIQKEN